MGTGVCNKAPQAWSTLLHQPGPFSCVLPFLCAWSGLRSSLVHRWMPCRYGSKHTICHHLNNTLRLKYETRVGLDKDFLNKKESESRLVMREGVAPVPEVCTWKAQVLHSMNHGNRRRYPLLRAHQALQRAAHSLTELLERIYEQSQLGQNGSILRQHRLGVLTHEPAKSSQHHCA